MWAAPLLVMAVVAAVALVRVSQPLPDLSLYALDEPAAPSSGVAPIFHWPKAGEAAAEVPVLGMQWESAPEKPVPIASVTKMMTAYIVLRDHPLSPDEQGPVITATPTDHLESLSDMDDDDSSVPIAAGERLTERQVLNGLLVHSADNFADMLARWDALSVPVFVAKMNRMAASLGMRDTHYADASGLNPATVSTPADQLKLAARVMSIPTFAAVVDQQTVTLPLAGRLDNYVSDIGIDGVVGIKSGFTSAAMGCMVLAARRDVGGRSVLILAAVTGQPGGQPLGLAELVSLGLINEVQTGLRVVTPVADGETLAKVYVPWDPSTKVSGSTSSAPSMVTFVGDDVSASIDPLKLGSKLTAGTTVGWLTLTDRQERARVRLVSSATVNGPSIGWRLLHG